ncbi:fatty acyl-CoA reductase 2 isoform X1, partial [Cricetulus griseus]
MSMIAAFYSNKSVLITGATGFLGKVLMEKLFRTSPHLKVIYILVRPKSGQTLQERVFQILNSKLFEKVKEVCPNVHEKIRPISADLNQRDFAISKEDMQELLSCTNIVFHCAATVRFDAHLRWLDDSIIDEITPKLIGDRPNTYTYTKALGEIVVQQESGNLNVAIVRPSIVGATWQEPFP